MTAPRTSTFPARKIKVIFRRMNQDLVGLSARPQSPPAIDASHAMETGSSISAVVSCSAEQQNWLEDTLTHRNKPTASPVFGIIICHGPA